MRSTVIVKSTLISERKNINDPARVPGDLERLMIKSTPRSSYLWRGHPIPGRGAGMKGLMNQSLFTTIRAGTSVRITC